MIKRVGISIILVIECLGMLIYFWRMSHDPLHIYWVQYGWTVFYDTSMMLPLSLLALLLAITDEKDRCIFDKYFLITIGLYTFTINMAVIAQYYNLIARTHGLQISTGGLIVATVLIVITAYKHGYYE